MSSNKLFSEEGIGEFELDKIQDYWTTKGNRSGWVCCKCNNFNYDNRKKCNMCDKPRSAVIVGEKNKSINAFMKENNIMLPQVAEKTKKLQIRAGDWECPRCKNINFSFRIACNRCGVKK